MTQEATPVGGEAPEPVETDPFEAMAEEFLGPDETDEDEEISEELGEAEADEAEAEADQEEAIEAEELPPIDAPVSYDAKAKEEFAKLPREAQEYWSKRESERERFVQTKSQEAAQAQRNASIEAMKVAEQIKAEAAQHLQRYAQQFEVKPPSAELFQRDPVAYAQQLEAYQNISAQREKAQRDAEKYRAEQAQIQQARQQHEAEAFHQQLQAEVPEVFDPSTGQEVLKQLTATAELLGFDPNQISDVQAIKALKVTSEWKTKSDKYDALMKKQMERVRSGKAPPPIAKPGTARAPEQTRKARGDAAWNKALEGARSGNRNLRDQAFADWADAKGIFD